MPTSAWDGRQWVTDQMARVPRTIRTVYDIGAGEGTNSILGRHLIWWAWWVGVEIHEPYFDRFMLSGKYSETRLGDARRMLPDVNGRYLIMFGDVLEHMPREDAVKMVRAHMARAAEIYVSVPIIHSPQGACFGNEHEAHVDQWTWEEMCDLLTEGDGHLEGFKGTEVGRFWWRRHVPTLQLVGEDGPELLP